MIDQEILVACETSLGALSKIAIEEGLSPSGCRKPLSVVRPFAEALLLCPVADAATQQMRRDRAGAEGFLQVAHFLVAQLRGGKGGIAILERGSQVGPYFHLSSAVIAFLDQYGDYQKSRNA